MKTILLFFAMILTFGTYAQKFKITRYEQKSNELFIAITHTKKPVYVEKFLTAEERKDSLTIQKAIEELVAELYIKADEYTEPEKYVSRPEKAEKFKADTVSVKTKKVEILAKRKLEKEREKQKNDSIETVKKKPVL